MVSEYCSARDLRVGGLVEDRRASGRFVWSLGLVSAMGGVIFAQHQRPTQHRLNRLSILGGQFFDVG
jgi:hypothetical protein